MQERRRDLADLIQAGRGDSEQADRLRYVLDRYDLDEALAIQAQEERIQQERERRKAKTGAVAYIDGKLCGYIKIKDNGIEIGKRRKVLNLIWVDNEFQIGKRDLFDQFSQRPYSVRVTDILANFWELGICRQCEYKRYELSSK